jgi:hypothetical protein
MEARTSGEPFVATLQIKIVGFPTPAGPGAPAVWDGLMEKLLHQPGIIDPIVSDDLDKGEVWISFEFEATGNVQEDVPKALGLLVEATRSDEYPPPFNWEQWLGGPTSAGTVQYPVYA